MNSPISSPPRALRSRMTVLAPIESWWTSLAARERLLIAVGSVALGVIALWVLAIQPAWTTLRTAPTEIDRLDAQWQSMQSLAAESEVLRAVPAMRPEQAAAALQAATDRLGANGRLQLQGDRATLTLTDATPQQLREWLAQARSGARARPLELSLTRSATGFVGTLVVSLGSAS